MTRVIATVVAQRGQCDAKHKVGDQFDVSSMTTKGLCPWALNSLFPFATVLRYGGTFPWESDKNKARVACPDADRQVIFELRRED